MTAQKTRPVRLDALRNDVRYALRTLRLRAGFAAAAVLTLALGIGSATAVFSVVDGVLLKPLPVADQGRLLVVWKTLTERGFERMPFTYASVEGMRDRLRTVSGVAAHPYHGSSRVVVQKDGEALPLQLSGVTGSLFEVLGVRPRAGRLLTAPDDHAGAAPAIVLSARAADRLYGSARNALGGRLRIGETMFTVVGIAPEGFSYPRGTEAWAAASPLYLSGPQGGTSLDEVFRIAWYLVVRAAPGFTVEQTRAELAAALATLPSETASTGEHQIVARSFTDVVVGDVRTGLLMLAGAVLLVLLIAGVNVANLLLVRGIARRRELAVRAAIGASRGRIVRQLTTEALVLVGAGALVAILVARVALRLLLALAPPELPRIDQLGIDGRALAFAAAAAVVTAILFGVLPALRGARVHTRALRARDDAAEPGRRAQWLRHGLVVAQMAITALVLSTAGLLLRSFDGMQRLDAGFAAEGVALVELDVPPSRYRVVDADARAATIASTALHQRNMTRLAERAAALPGITAATSVLTHPFSGNGGADAIWYGEGQARDESTNPYANYEGVDAAYFATMGLTVVRGRAIDERDRAGSAPVVVVNRAFAALYWPGEDAVGRRIKLGGADSPDEWRTIVGVAADTRYREWTDVRPGVYVPYEQGIPVSPRYIGIRTMDPGAVAAVIRRMIAEEEPVAAVVGITPLPRLLAEPLARPRFQSALVSSFALLGLVLSVVGAYGVLAFFVRQRAREIGIRMALGATPSAVRRFVLGQGLAMGAGGVLIGLTAAAAAGRLLESLLFGVSATDPIVLAVTAATLLTATIAATLVPTRAATRTDPMLVMRSD